MSEMLTKLITDSTTEDKTFDAISFDEVKKATFMFTRADDAGGDGVFTVEGSVDGETYVALNLLVDNVTDSNAESLTRVASCTLATETSKLYALDLEHFCFKMVRVALDETTSGTHSYKALLEY